MPAKKLVYAEDARKSLRTGIDILADAGSRLPWAPVAATSCWTRSLAPRRSAPTA